MEEKVSVADVKNRFSEYIAKVAYSNRTIIITKRNRPIAAIVDLDFLKKVKTANEIKGLSSVVGKWKNFHEISTDIDKSYKSRNKDKLRNVSI